MKTLFKFLGTVLTAVIVTLGVAVGHAYYEVNNAPKIPTVPEMIESVVQVNIEGEGLCSGWVLQGTNKIITDAHCAGDQPGIIPLNVQFYNSNTTYKVHITKLGDSSGTFESDLAVLTLDDPVAPVPKGLPLCTKTPYYGQFTAFLGSPLGARNTTTYGWVSNPSVDLSDLGGFFDKNFIQIDTKMLPGNSGGPLIDTNEGCVLGMADFIRIVNPTVDIAYGNNYATPASDIQEFLNSK